MKVRVIGSGSVARSLGRCFTARGDEVMLGSRSPEKLEEWRSESGEESAGTMAEAAAHGELLVMAAKGTEVESAVAEGGAESFDGKVLMDVTNPPVFGEGVPTLAWGTTDSGGERLQRAVLGAKVVKTLNIVNAGQMVDPEVPNGPATMFVAGEDEEAKAEVTGILGDFGWSGVIDLGGIEAARELESLCVLWVRYAVPAHDFGAAFRLLR
ncbi:MAG: NADP oxidoreductase [Actinobacteria bacterium]|nr:NADP oxidoreductase [Actinomycetota bacterium]